MLQAIKQKLVQNSRVVGRSALLFVISGLLITASLVVPNASADSFDAQIRALQAQNARNRAKVIDLSKTATSYQDAIGQLQGQISELEGSITENLAKQAELQQKIEDGQRELDRQRQLLAADIRAMYSDGDISTVEILATSKDLSEFVDKETYRNAVQQKIQDTLKRITKLQADLKQEKQDVEDLITKQESEQSALEASRSEQNRMLAKNQQEQAAFNQQTKDNQAKIDDLIAQQRRANEGAVGGYYFIRFPGSIKDHDVTVDDYPYKDDGFSMQLGPCSNTDSYPDHPDKWGYCTRQCVSYTAWAVERSGRNAPRFYGNAKNWIYAAPASYVHRDPKPGDVAITTGGNWGHAMYVEKVDGDRIYVSQYNQQLTGRYSTQWRKYR